MLYNFNLSKTKNTSTDISRRVLLESVFSISSLEYLTKFEFINHQEREVALFTKDINSCENPTSFIFKVKDVVSFECFTQSNLIHYKLYTKGTEKLLEYWLSHILLPIFFTIKNEYYFLHAGSVRIENQTVLFMADSMGGKSTLTSHFIQKKHTLVSDDKVGLFEKDGNFMAVSSHPHYRPYRNFEDLGIKVDNFEQDVTQVNVLYILDVDEKYQEVYFSEIKGIEKFSRLIRGTEIGLPFFQKERFEFITKLANVTPVYRIHIPKDLNRLDEVYDAIIQHNTILKDHT